MGDYSAMGSGEMPIPVLPIIYSAVSLLKPYCPNGASNGATI